MPFRKQGEPNGHPAKDKKGKTISARVAEPDRKNVFGKPFEDRIRLWRRYYGDKK